MQKLSTFEGKKNLSKKVTYNLLAPSHPVIDCQTFNHYSVGAIKEALATGKY